MHRLLVAVSEVMTGLKCSFCSLGFPYSPCVPYVRLAREDQTFLSSNMHVLRYLFALHFSFGCVTEGATEMEDKTPEH
jgi:hypothetical protein